MIDVPGKTLKQITKLNLSRLDLKEVPEDIFLCTNLTKLDLSHNQICRIPKEIEKLKKLKVLNISYNQVKQLYASVFNLPALVILDISHNKIKSIPKQISNSNIQSLIASHNEISRIEYENLDRIKKFVVRNNKLERFELSKPLTKLEQLWIGSNPIKHFAITKEMLPSLKYLYCYTGKAEETWNHEYLNFCRCNGNSIHFVSSTKECNKVNIPSIKVNKSMKIFVSYSHEDKNWLDLVNKYLTSLKKYYPEVVPWSDQNLRTGDKWKEKIEEALNNADIAILLVSTDFLISDFISNKEVLPLLENAKKKGTKIFSVILSPCMFEDSEIKDYQAVNNPGLGGTLEECTKSEQKRIMLKLIEDIKSCL